MLDKSNKKISVLNKMIGLGEEVGALDSSYIVPQNSISNLKSLNNKMVMQPMENTTCNLIQGANACKCPHCENMAKNFLYLESLIRSNKHPNNNCNVCHSSLQYLQHVNRSILKVFGNFDSVAEAAKAFGVKSKTKKSSKVKSKSLKKLTSSSHSTTGKVKASAKKHIVVKKFNTTTHAHAHVHVKSNKKTMGSSNSFGKSTGRIKKSHKKSSFLTQSSNYSTGKPESVESAAKPTKMKKLKALKGKTQNLFRKLKSIK